MERHIEVVEEEVSLFRIPVGISFLEILTELLWARLSDYLSVEDLNNFACSSNDGLSTVSQIPLRQYALFIKTTCNLVKVDSDYIYRKDAIKILKKLCVHCKVQTNYVDEFSGNRVCEKCELRHRTTLYKLTTFTSLIQKYPSLTKSQLSNFKTIYRQSPYDSHAPNLKFFSEHEVIQYFQNPKIERRNENEASGSDNQSKYAAKQSNEDVETSESDESESELWPAKTLSSINRDRNPGRRRARAKEKGTFKFSAVKAQTRGKANSTGKPQNKKGKRIPKWKSKSSWKAGPDSQINTCVSSFETNAEYGLAISGITCLQLADS
mmetsp:Transcript_13134/g.17024  ORF Transcript_13134/g.17024 Transcript_13134/m.17024 type:complete len:323 (+) Transcript_13134:332-1300(+)